MKALDGEILLAHQEVTPLLKGSRIRRPKLCLWYSLSDIITELELVRDVKMLLWPVWGDSSTYSWRDAQGVSGVSPWAVGYNLGAVWEDVH